MHSPQTIIVLGASAGGVESLMNVVEGLPADFEAAVLIAVHTSPDKPSSLPEILNRCGPLRASHARNGEALQAQRIYITPPGHDLLVEGAKVAVIKGASENRFRPSIDSLFHSAAYHYGRKAIGVVLSGALDDGTPGIRSIKRCGGITVVQEPSDARYDSMPLSVIKQMEVNFILPSHRIGPLLARLVEMNYLQASAHAATLFAPRDTESDIFAERNVLRDGVMDINDLTPFTCPECHRVLMKWNTHPLSHAWHLDEDAGWETLRTLEERVMVLQHLAHHIEDRGGHDRADVFHRRARELEQHSNTIRHSLARR